MSTCTNAIKLASANAKLFHDSDNNCYLTQTNSRGKEITWPVGSKDTWEWLSGLHFAKYNKALRSQQRDEIISTLKAMARTGESHAVHRRVAKSGDRYVLDLNDDNGNVVIISASGWEITPHSPVRFLRKSDTGALPVPEISTFTDTAIWQCLNVAEHDRPLVIAWAVECLRPETPKPILQLVGQQGSAKSTTQQYLKRLFDPETCNLYAAITKRDDLFLYGANSWLMSLDNLSNERKIPQDDFCCISTGAGYAKRELYTDDGLYVAQIKRPIVVSGIAPVFTKSDLISRTLTVHIPKLESTLSPRQVEALFEQDAPKMLGALLTAFSEGMANYDESERLGASHRLRDFEIFGNAIYLRSEKGLISKLLDEITESEKYDALNGSPVAMGLINCLQKQGNEYIGPAQELWELVEQNLPENTSSHLNNARGFVGRLEKDWPLLERLGVIKGPLASRRNVHHYILRGELTSSSGGTGTQPY